MEGTELPTDMWNCIIANFAIDRTAQNLSHTTLSRIMLYSIGLVSKQFHNLVKKYFIKEDKGKLWELRYYVMNLLADLGCLDLLQYFKEYKQFELSFDVANHAARHGHVHILEYCFQQKCPMRHTVADNACQGGHLECLKYAMSHKVVAKQQAAVEACENDSVECLEYLIEKKVDWNKMKMVEKAISCNAMKCLLFALNNGGNITPSAFSYAVSSRSIEMLEFIFEKLNRTWTTNAESEIVRFGTIEMLEYATNNFKVEWTPDAVSISAQIGNLEKIKYFLKLGIKIGQYAASQAVIYGSYDCLKLLLENDCPKCESAVSNAATKGRMDMLKLMREYGWDWSENLGSCVAHGTPYFSDILLYALENGYQWDRYKCSLRYENPFCAICENMWRQLESKLRL